MSCIKSISSLIFEAADIDQLETGLGQTQRYLLDAYLHLDPDLEVVIVGPKDRAHEFESSRGDASYVSLNSCGISTRWQTLSTLLRTQEGSILLATNNLFPIVADPSRVVLITHDFSHGRWDSFAAALTQGLWYHLYHVRCVSSAAVSLFRSETIRNEALTLARVRGTHRAIWADCAPSFKGSQGDAKVTLLEEMRLEPHRYILVPGRTRPRYKGIEDVIQATSALKARGQELDLVLVSTDEAPSTLAKRALESHVRIRTLRNLEGAALRALYRFASVCVYPSKYEGFGLPILEAQNMGCPLIVRDTTVAREIAGVGAAYFSAPNQLARYMLDILTSPSTAGNLVAAGRMNAKRFSWTACARTLDQAMDAIA